MKPKDIRMQQKPTLREMERSIGVKNTRTVDLDLTRGINDEFEKPLVFETKVDPETKVETVIHTTLREILAHAHAMTFQDDSITGKRLRWDMRVRIKAAGDLLTVTEMEAEAIDDIVSKVMVVPIAGQVHCYITEVIEAANAPKEVSRFDNSQGGPVPEKQAYAV